MLIHIAPGLTNTGDTDALLEREWLLTNAVGGFAMGTALGAPTRRYHALLIAAAKPPVDRVVVLHHLLEQLTLNHGDGTTTTLAFGPMLFAGDAGQRLIVPDDTPMLQRFDCAGAAVWSYQHDGLTFTRRLVLHDGEPACTVHYDLTGLNSACESATLTLRPFITLRGFHDIRQQHNAGDTYETNIAGDTLRVQHAGRAASYRMPGGTTTLDPQWWNAIQYPIEQRRGQGNGEDLYAPATFTLQLPASDDATADFTATLGGQPAKPMHTPSARAKRISAIGQALWDAVFPPPLPSREGPGEGRQHATQYAEDKQDDRPSPQPPPWEGGGAIPTALARAADDFVVKRSVGDRELSTIIAGYPWFADWGRDTFIALPGLLLCTGRHDEARDTLAAFAKVIRNGLVPNRFDDADPALAHYNTVDASLWFVHSALEYLEHTGDHDAWNAWLAQACVQVIEGYATGTLADAHDGTTTIDIAMQPDGLIAAGTTTSQLTWMDAAAPAPGSDPGSDGQVHVFTPRPGKCVEINALWHSALARLGERLPDAFSDERLRYATLAPRVAQSFSRVFWPEFSERRHHLVDHVAPDGAGGWVADRALRPNMMIACALKHSPVHPEYRAASIHAVREKLLTPVGLRTLPQDDPDYHPRYEGDAFARDGAYHRGIVWPWLIGPYAEAVLRQGGFSDDAKREARAAIEPLLERLTTTHHPGAIGQLHEIYEPEPPFAPRGCPAQAWSVAEVLRVWHLIALGEPE